VHISSDMIHRLIWSNEL